MRNFRFRSWACTDEEREAAPLEPLVREDRLADGIYYAEYTDSPPAEKKAGTSDDPVQHPAHYTTGKIECIDYIEDKELGFHLGNAVKYITRAGKKDPAKTVEDLEKAVWYIQRKIELLKKEGKA